MLNGFRIFYSQAGTLNSGGGGGGTNIQKVGVDAAVPPGTNPVLANPANEIFVHGLAVANTGIPIETISRSANTFNIEVQNTIASASSTAGLQGLASFNSANFTVDGNGFVSLIGGTTNTFIGDSGSAMSIGGVLNIITDSAAQHSGSSVTFVASGNTVQLNVTDANANTLVGQLAGANLSSGTNNTSLGYETFLNLTLGNNNTALGYLALSSLTSGTFNSGIGADSLKSLVNGSYNIALGYNSGTNYTTSESSNIVIGNIGTATESHVIRIGTQGTGNEQQNECFVAGIVGVTVSPSEAVFISSSTGQLGVISQNADGEIIIGSSAGSPLAATITAGTGITVTNGHNSITLSVNGSVVGETITGNDGTALSPTAGNWNIDGNGVIGSGVSTAGNIYTTGSGSTLTINNTEAQFATNYTNVAHAASPYTVLATDYYISVDCSAGTVTLKFPNAPTANRIWIVKDRTGSASTNNITITTVGGAVDIDGVTSYVITGNYAAVNLLANATPTYEVY